MLSSTKMTVALFVALLFTTCLFLLLGHRRDDVEKVVAMKKAEAQKNGFVLEYGDDKVYVSIIKHDPVAYIDALRRAIDKVEVEKNMAVVEIRRGGISADVVFFLKSPAEKAEK